MKKANALLQETSPYLLQHAYNPVEWYPWGETALQKSKQENKPILLSIGYSACHWCHVMEHQSFENERIAALMNEHFVCIKVDREERPDIDHIYMDALQAMGQNGGWPLNVFLTPDQQPFWGGTYFPPQQWFSILQQIAKVYQEQPQEIISTTQALQERLTTSEIVKYGIGNKGNLEFQVEKLAAAFARLHQERDKAFGGIQKAPKFPMPSIWLFLLRYHHATGNPLALEWTTQTLQKMADGGIYDQIGGGFSRYSVDGEWFAPHFEKMLYDNGQLLSLYSEAYILTKNEYFKAVILETVDFVLRELYNEAEGSFYAALDADSEGEEGLFYVWEWKELKEILGDEIKLFAAYYNVKENGNWENHKNILHKTETDETFAAQHKIALPILQLKVKEWKQMLLQMRNKKVRPSLDDKVLAGWNGLMLKGIIDAYNATQVPQFLQIAEKNMQFIIQKMSLSNGKLYRSYKNGIAKLDACLEDYAAVIQAAIALYQANFDEKLLQFADNTTQYVQQHFFDEQEGYYYFTDSTSESLIARKKEVFDNVIPASNSVMANNLYWLGKLLDKESYVQQAEKMTLGMQRILDLDIQYASNWASAYLAMSIPTTEVVIVGENCLQVRQEIAKNYYPNCIFVGTTSTSNLPLLQERVALNGQTTIYVCRNKTCQLPVHSVADALALL
jgi:uncharacterized protein YyaL (SSP411 family)